MIEQTCQLFPQLRDKIDYIEIGKFAPLHVSLSEIVILCLKKTAECLNLFLKNHASLQNSYFVRMGGFNFKAEARLPISGLNISVWINSIFTNIFLTTDL